MTAMLEINNLKKTFENGSPALKGVDLKINKGEFVSILGPSGSGKTTLLRTINGLETSTGGEIYFDNKKVNNNNISEVQKKTGMIFQEFNLVNNLSAINNVLTGLLNSSNKFLSLFYLFSKEQKIEALRSLETVGLLEKSHNRSDELSGGQRQRVGIARAIIKKPLLLLADEPVASLDPKSSNLILSLLKKINQEFGTTILCNLHQVDLAKKYSDRVVGLIDGKIIFDEKSVNINEVYLKKIYT
jgi:phosphonate transport system ATP-binding protein